MKTSTTTLLLLLTTLATLACAKPLWVKEFPADPQAYIAVIKVDKKAYPSADAYQKAADSKALATIARAISTKITTTTTGITTEANNALSSEFSEEITAQAQANLTGYDKEVYENRKEYWVYFRLKKSTWAHIEQKRLTQSIAQAQEYLDAGTALEQEGNPAGAIRHYVEAFKVIQPTLYLNPSIEYQGKTTPLLALIDTKARSLLTTLFITAPQPLFKGLRTQYQQTAPVITINYHDAPISRFPLSILGDTYESDAGGKIMIPYEKVQSNDNNALIITSNWHQILSLSPQDSSVVSLWVSQLPWPRVTTSIIFVRPTIAVTSSEYNLGKKLVNAPLETKLKEQLNTLNYPAPSSRKQPDYTLTIDASTRYAGFYQSILFAYVDVTWSLTDKEGNEIIKISLDPIKGGALTKEQAGLKAFNKARGEVADAVSLWLEQHL